MESGYYLATNKASCVDEVVWVQGDKVYTISAGLDVVLKFKLDEWSNIVGPIDRGSFSRGCGS